MKKGFTLIELLVVVLIIGILSAVALPKYNAAVLKTRATEVSTNLSAIEKAFDMHFLQDGVPLDDSSDFSELMQYGDITLSGGTWNSSGSTFATKNFTYSLNWCLGNDGRNYDCFFYITQTGKSLANEDFRISFHLKTNSKDREYSCTWKTQAGKATCSSFHGDWNIQHNPF